MDDRLKWDYTEKWSLIHSTLPGSMVKGSADRFGGLNLSPANLPLLPPKKHGVSGAGRVKEHAQDCSQFWKYWSSKGQFLCFGDPLNTLVFRIKTIKRWQIGTWHLLFEPAVFSKRSKDSRTCDSQVFLVAHAAGQWPKVCRQPSGKVSFTLSFRTLLLIV